MAKETATADARLKPDAYITDGKRLYRVIVKLASGVYSVEDVRKGDDLFVRLSEQDILTNMTLVKPDERVDVKVWREEHPDGQAEQQAQGPHRSKA